MLLHISLRQLDANGEDTDSKNDSGEFEGDRVHYIDVPVPPASGIEYVRTVRSCLMLKTFAAQQAGAELTDDDPKQKCPTGFTDIQLKNV